MFVLAEARCNHQQYEFIHHHQVRNLGYQSLLDMSKTIHCAHVVLISQKFTNQDTVYQSKLIGILILFAVLLELNWIYFHHQEAVQYEKLHVYVLKFLLLPDESLRFHSNLYSATVFAEGCHQKSVVIDNVWVSMILSFTSRANAEK